MKKIILAIIVALTFASSCSMDEIPLENMPPEIAYRDSFRVEMFVNDLYAYVNCGRTYNYIGPGGAGSMFDCITDLGVYSPVGLNAAIRMYAESNINKSAGGNPDDSWAVCYTGIRKANVFLKYVSYANMSEGRTNRMIGEAKFFKAYLHFELIRRYGGIPVMDDLLDVSGNTNIPRSSYEDCVNYVVNLLDEAAQTLPTRYANNDYGRITKGTAYGFKASMLLYAASPLFNESPLPGTNELHRYASPDKERWKKAAEAALQVINLKNPNGSSAHELYPNYQRFFFTKDGNYEGLLMRQNTLTNAVDKANGPAGFQGARGNSNLTLEYINMFEVKTGGLPKDDPNFDWQKPYENRDDRFYSSVLYNGSQLWGRQVETFVGGLDYPSGVNEKGCRTGFTMFKHIDPQVSIITPEIRTYHDFPVLRLSDILLTYAEAMNEYLGSSDSDQVSDNLIYECMNKVRDRGGIHHISSLTKGEMREYIKRERVVELAFEEKRYYDLKRWRDAETVLNRPVHGVTIEKVGSSFIYHYEKNGNPIEIEKRIFLDKMYYYPIPQSEMNKNTALIQNPGW